MTCTPRRCRGSARDRRHHSRRCEGTNQARRSSTRLISPRCDGDLQGGRRAGGRRALAYGTKTIAPVLKIYGPGNAYVVEAKAQPQVFGQVAIDLLPGPSEILIIADKSANPSWIAADMLAQAEHGHGSSVGLITDSPKILAEVRRSEVKAQAAKLSRQKHLLEVLEKHTFLVLVEKLRDAVKIANDFAPEHLSIVAKDEGETCRRYPHLGRDFPRRTFAGGGRRLYRGPEP